MKLPEFITLAGLLCLLITLPASLYAQEPRMNRLFETPAQILRCNAGRVYLWIETPVAINSDFTATISDGNGEVASLSVADCAGKVVVTEPISDSLTALIQSLSSATVLLFLDSSNLGTDEIVIGLPEALNRDFDTASAPESSLPVSRRYSYYDDLEEAEIDLAVGNLQILVLPSIEMDAELDCNYNIYQSENLIEWYFMLDLPDHDLYPAALSYCLKNAFSDSAQVSEVGFLDSQHFDNFFPPHPQHATALFSQMRGPSRERSCAFTNPLEFPGTLAFIDRKLRFCGGGIKFRKSDNAEGILLAMSMLPADSADGIQRLLWSQLLSEASLAGFSWSDFAVRTLLGENEDYDSISRERIETVSYKLASELRVIPLGTTRLTIVTRPELHYIARENQPVSVNDFYMVTNR